MKKILNWVFVVIGKGLYMNWLIEWDYWYDKKVFLIDGF